MSSGGEYAAASWCPLRRARETPVARRGGPTRQAAVAVAAVAAAVASSWSWTLWLVVFGTDIDSRRAGIVVRVCHRGGMAEFGVTLSLPFPFLFYFLSFLSFFPVFPSFSSPRQLLVGFREPTIG